MNNLFRRPPAIYDLNIPDFFRIQGFKKIYDLKKGKKLRPRPPAIYDLNYPIFSDKPRTPKQKKTQPSTTTLTQASLKPFFFFQSKTGMFPKLATSHMAFFQTTLAHPSQKLFVGFLASHLKIHGQQQLCLGFLSGKHIIPQLHQLVLVHALLVAVRLQGINHCMMPTWV